MKETTEDLRKALEQRKFWEKEVRRIEAKLAPQADGVFPRLANLVEPWLYPNSFAVVTGRIGSKWPSILVDRKTRRTKRVAAGYMLFDSYEDQINGEPDWLSEDDERALVAEFPKSKWAKEIMARLS